MSSAIIQLIVLAGVAIFLILRLRNVLGTREGFEKPALPVSADLKPAQSSRRGLEVIDGGPDADITDHVAAESPMAKALAAMKAAEPSFGVTDFLRGARGAYEMIIIAFDKGQMDTILPFLSRDVYDSFVRVVETREAAQLAFGGGSDSADNFLDFRFYAEEQFCGDFGNHPPH